MSARWVHYFSDPPPNGCTDLKSLLGGKGASLNELSRAGLNVPPGFTISPACCAHYLAHGRTWPEGLEAEVQQNLARLELATGRKFGSPERPLLVSVRSGAAVSMPGMMDTLLNVDGKLAECINAVFESFNSERALAYRQHHRIDGLLGTAVTIQAMFPSEVSGVLFTRDPVRHDCDDLLIEAARGLGENVVSGAVTPDRFVVRRGDLACIERTVVDSPTLNDQQIAELSRLALRIEQHYGHAIDLEWGWAEGQFALLQARPIRERPQTDDLEPVRLAEISRVRLLAGKDRKVWVLHNLAETLPAPTPLTWDIVRQFMRGDGGFGRLYQSLGHRPSRRVREEGFLELIGGRIYADPQRLAELFWDGLPLAYDLDALLVNPALLDQAPLRFDADRATSRFLTTLPANLWGMWRAGGNMQSAARDARRRFEARLPDWLAYVKQERARELDAMSDTSLIALLHQRIEDVLDDFGPESLRPGFFGGLAYDCLRTTLVRFMDSAGAELADRLTSGLQQGTTMEQDSMLQRVARQEATLEDFLARFGHRAAGEMELAQPRWREDPQAIEQLIEHLRRSGGNHSHRGEEPISLPEQMRRFGFSSLREQVEADLALARELLPYRETGKHYLMMGYELLRQVTELLARRWHLGRDLYFLRLDELPQFPQRAVELTAQIDQRRQCWRLLQQLHWPTVIDSNSLENLGNIPAAQLVDELSGQPMAGGAATGTAAVIFDPRTAADLPDGYVLVCPSTDPGWAPLFVNARGLIVERGGVLSHGAIVARDFGIPAIACPDATRLLKTGDTIRIDGHAGRVQVLKREAG